MNQYFPLPNNFFLSLNRNFTFHDLLSIHHKKTLDTESVLSIFLGGILSHCWLTLQTRGFGMFIAILESLHSLEKMLFKDDFLKNKATQYRCIVVAAAACHFVFIQVGDNCLFYLLNICQLNDSFTQKHWPKFKFIGCSWKQ